MKNGLEAAACTTSDVAAASLHCSGFLVLNAAGRSGRMVVSRRSGVGYGNRLPVLVAGWPRLPPPAPGLWPRERVRGGGYYLKIHASGFLRPCRLSSGGRRRLLQAVSKSTIVDTNLQARGAHNVVEPADEVHAGHPWERVGALCLQSAFQSRFTRFYGFF